MIEFTRRAYHNGGVTETRETVGVGTTLYVKSESERVMSDVWEYVDRVYYWDGEMITNVYLDHDTKYTIDCTDYEPIFAAVRQRAFEHELQRARSIAEDNANIPAVKGAHVRVTRGRNHKGVEGHVVVVKEDTYHAGYKSHSAYKIAIAVDDEMTEWTARNGKKYLVHKNVAWVWARNCDVVDPKPDYAAAESRANAEADAVVARVIRNATTGGNYKMPIAA